MQQQPDKPATLSSTGSPRSSSPRPSSPRKPTSEDLKKPASDDNEEAKGHKPVVPVEVKVVDQEAEEEQEAQQAVPPRHDKLDEGTDTYVEVLGARKGHEELHGVWQWQDLKLKPEIMRALLIKGFAKPSKIQAVALPYILCNQDHMIAQAKNGSGKTAAFALALISKVDEASSTVQGLALAPSRELAQQNLDVIKDLARFTAVKCHLGSPPHTSFPEDTQIISGTPGKVREWLMKKRLNPQTLRVFVLDEADVMIDEESGMGAQVLEIAKVVRRTPNLQILLFSATYPKRVQMFAEKMAPNARRLVMRKEALTLATTQQFYCHLAPDDNAKIKTLKELYQSMVVGQSVVFCNTRRAADAVARALQAEGYSVTLICGSGGRNSNAVEMTTQAREERMQQFRAGTTRVLITTDLLSRGIDVPAVTLVINYELPISQQDRGVEHETYLHRVGRTGRFGAQGVAISFVTSEHDRELIKDLEAYYQCEIKQMPLDFEAIYEMMKNLRL